MCSRLDYLYQSCYALQVVNKKLNEYAVTFKPNLVVQHANLTITNSKANTDWKHTYQTLTLQIANTKVITYVFGTQLLGANQTESESD